VRQNRTEFPAPSERKPIELENTPMNTRERFLAVMNLKPVDRTLQWEMGYWAKTVRQWYEQGLPCKKGVPESLKGNESIQAEAITMDPESIDPLDTSLRDSDVHDYFGLDEPIWRLPLNLYFSPKYDPEVLEDHGDWILHRNEFGVVVKDMKAREGFPDWIGAPVKKREDWEKIKAERLQPNLRRRLPENWEGMKEAFRDRTFPLILAGWPCGFYGVARYLLGEVEVLTMFYDDPELMHDIMDYMADFWCTLYDEVLKEIDVDGCLFWEDMCYRNGSLISPEFFREFMLPGYKRVTGCLRDNGVTVNIVDTDGNCWDLIPLLMEGGVNVLYPCEVGAGMDVLEIRRAFPNLALMGGIDKKRMAKSHDAIDEELEGKVPAMLKSGGYVPFTDHSVPSDVPWEHFKYYRRRLNMLVSESG
jgi:uroporphyrinogen decarboxylase